MSALDNKHSPNDRVQPMVERKSNDSISKAYVEHAEDAEALEQQQAADRFGTNTAYSAEERRLVRKLDWRLMPILFASYFMNKLDQNAIANARLNNLEKDLGLTGNQFNICVSVLYAGYTVIQVGSLSC